MIVYSEVDITTASDGTGTGTTDRAFTGYLVGIQYVKNNFASGVDLTVTNADGSVTYWTGTDVNASTIVYPRTQVHDNVGAGLTYDGTRKVMERFPLIKDKVKVNITSGGDTKTGTFYIVADALGS
jgi:hypothetical protein